MNNLRLLVKLQIYFPQLGQLRDAGMIIFLTDIEGARTTSVLPTKTFGSNGTSIPDALNVSKCYLYSFDLNCDGSIFFHFRSESQGQRLESQMACCLMCSTVSELSKHNYGTTTFAWIISKSTRKSVTLLKWSCVNNCIILCACAALRWQD